MATTPFAPQPDPVRDAAEDTAGEFVMMHFPRKVVLTLQNFHFVTFNPGPQKVPVSLADHDWLRRNGAKRIDSTAAPAKSKAEVKAEAEAATVREASEKEAADAKVAKMNADATEAANAAAQAPPAPKAAEEPVKANGKSKSK